MSNIAIFGGSFNPPTTGHIAFVKFLLKHFDEVWVTPCSTHMFNKDMASSWDRLEMCEIAFGSIPNAKVFDYEICNNLSGATIDLVTSLLDDPVTDGHNLCCAIGMDNANNFHKWIESEKLLDLVPFVVVPRQGEEIDNTIDWYRKPPHRLLIPDDAIPNTSSTEVRRIFRATGGFSRRLLELVPYPVWEYGLDKGFYDQLPKD